MVNKLTAKIVAMSAGPPPDCEMALLSPLLKGSWEAVILIPGLDRHCSKASHREEKTCTLCDAFHVFPPWKSP
jgi:hypothetical protein